MRGLIADDFAEVRAALGRDELDLRSFERIMDAYRRKHDAIYSALLALDDFPVAGEFIDNLRKVLREGLACTSPS